MLLLSVHLVANHRFHDVLENVSGYCLQHFRVHLSENLGHHVFHTRFSGFCARIHRRGLLSSGLRNLMGLFANGLHGRWCERRLYYFGLRLVAQNRCQ
jgi:hypothetical protein